MPKHYTVDEAVKFLQVTPRTLRRWMTAQGMQNADDPADGRKRLLTQAQVDALAARHRPVTLVAPVAFAAPVEPTLLVELRAEVNYLRSRIKALESQIARNATQAHQDGQEPPSASSAIHFDVDTLPAHSGAPAVRSRQASGARVRDNRRITETPDMPTALLPLHKLAEAHGVHTNTARKQWEEQGIFQVTGPYKVGRNIKVWGIDHENAVRALRAWLERGAIQPDDLGHCSLPNCPCGELIEAEGNDTSDNLEKN